MKKRVIAVALLAAMALTGCGSQAFTGEKTGEVASAFGGNATATVKFEDGTPVSVELDVKNDDGSLKSEASASGEYDLNNAPGKKWHEQADLVEEALVENNFDISKIVIDENGKTDAISGVSIAINEFLEATQAALDQVK